MSSKISSTKFIFCWGYWLFEKFEDIGKRYGPMDLSLIPIGAYARRWFMKYMHVYPEEAVKIHMMLRVGNP